MMISSRNDKENFQRDISKTMPQINSKSKRDFYQLVEDELEDCFVWRKKEMRDRKRKLPRDSLQKKRQNSLDKYKTETESIKRRRLKHEKAAEERAQAQLQQTIVAGEFEDWIKEENMFHLKQAWVRSQIRLCAGRPQPIDLLAQYIHDNSHGSVLDDLSPSKFITNLNIIDLEHLLEDTKVYMKFNEASTKQFWEDVLTITTDEIKKNKNDQTSIVSRRREINSEVCNDIDEIFIGKSSAQLKLLEKQIYEKMAGEDSIDVPFWEDLIPSLQCCQARARLAEHHDHLIRQKQQSKVKSHRNKLPNKSVNTEVKSTSEQCDEKYEMNQKGADVTYVGFHTSETDARWKSADQDMQHKTEEKEFRMNDIKTSIEDSHFSSTIQGYSDDAPSHPTTGIMAGNKYETHLVNPDQRKDSETYNEWIETPTLLNLKDLNKDVIITDGEDDLRRLLEARDKVKRTFRFGFDTYSDGSQNEDDLNSEVQVESRLCLWSEKYRPRKPRYFNRVHTGFSWNRYNRTHFDTDNPPPKRILGYKFNIVYSDLIDKSKIPTFTVTPCKDNKDFSVLHFMAGPPYEDVAFKIVSGEWNQSCKHGYKCNFDRDVLQLWFYFKRMCYRR